MACDQLQKLFPDLDASELKRAVENPAVRAASEDLNIALSELARSGTTQIDRQDWETTRDELEAEIRRLSLSMGRKS